MIGGKKILVGSLATLHRTITMQNSNGSRAKLKQFICNLPTQDVTADVGLDSGGNTTSTY